MNEENPSLNERLILYLGVAIFLSLIFAVIVLIVVQLQQNQGGRNEIIQPEASTSVIFQ